MDITELRTCHECGKVKNVSEYTYIKSIDYLCECCDQCRRDEYLKETSNHD